MKIAVVLVNYNGLSDTLECIESLMSSLEPVRVIVVDNASKQDEAKCIIEKYPFVKVFRIEDNLGFAGGNNVGIKWALKEGYEYIALLNNDTIIDKNLFSLLLQNSDNDTVVAPYMYYYSNPTSLWYGGGTINRWTGNAKHFKSTIVNPFLCSFVTGCCFLAHRNIWEKVGFLDDSYFMYNEDTDFCLRLLNNAVKIKVVPAAKLWHKVGKSSGGEKSAFSIYYITRNRLHYIRLYRSFFGFTAYSFTLFTRYLWMIKLMLQKKKEWRAFSRAIADSKKNIMGKSF